MKKIKRYSLDQIKEIDILSKYEYDMYRDIIKTIKFKPCTWWLKTKDNVDESLVYCVDGDYSLNKKVYSDKCEVRPSFLIELIDSKKYSIGDTICVSKYNCTIIDISGKEAFVISNITTGKSIEYSYGLTDWKNSRLLVYVKSALMDEMKRTDCYFNIFNSIYIDYLREGLYILKQIEENAEKEFDFIIYNNYTKPAYVALYFASKEKSFKQISEETYSVKYKLKDYKKCSFLCYCLFRIPNGDFEKYEEMDACRICYQNYEHTFNRYYIYKDIRNDYSNLVPENDYWTIRKFYEEMKKENFSNVVHSKKYNDIYHKLLENKKVKSKWVSEIQMYHLLKSVYPDAKYQFKAKWLGNQSIDVYVPSIKTAFEYQGRQHFEPIDFFGGEEKFQIQIKNDQKKLCLCKERNIEMIYWRYDEEISMNQLNKKLKLCKNSHCNHTAVLLQVDGS